jgi:hypothetical protein
MLDHGEKGLPVLLLGFARKNFASMNPRFPRTLSLLPVVRSFSSLSEGAAAEVKDFQGPADKV